MENSRMVSLRARFLAAQSVAREAGNRAQRYLDEPDHLEVRLKGPHDFVSTADRGVEALILERLREAFPDDAFLGEESFDADAKVDATMLWVIDPIDGTANFVRAGSEWCVSIGFIESNVPVFGVIYHPSSGHLYAARQGGGAVRDGVPIHVSGCETLRGSTVGLDYSSRTRFDRHAAHVRTVLERGGEYRRNGSGALSLAYVAEGRLDGFFEQHLFAWDVVAAIALVREAGGWTSDFLSGSGLTKGKPFVACAPAMRREFLEALGDDAITSTP